MTGSIRPAINPLAQRAAIDALEAQRAAYQRFARLVEQQQSLLGDGDGHRASAFADEAVLGFQQLDEGARRLAPLLAEARASGTVDDAQAMRRELDALARETERAELAIRNLSTQLEAWRDAYGRQLSELGVVPGGAASGAPADEPTGGASDVRAPAGGYGPRGVGARRTMGTVPSLIDRRG